MGDLRRSGRPDRESASEKIRDRTVCAVLVVRRAPGARDARTEGAWIREKLVHEPVLSEPGLSDDRDDPTLARERVVEIAHQERW